MSDLHEDKVRRVLVDCTDRLRTARLLKSLRARNTILVSTVVHLGGSERIAACQSGPNCARTAVLIAFHLVPRSCSSLISSVRTLAALSLALTAVCCTEDSLAIFTGTRSHKDAVMYFVHTNQKQIPSVPLILLALLVLNIPKYCFEIVNTEPGVTHEVVLGLSSAVVGRCLRIQGQNIQSNNVCFLHL